MFEYENAGLENLIIVFQSFIHCLAILIKIQTFKAENVESKEEGIRQSYKFLIKLSKINSLDS